MREKASISKVKRRLLSALLELFMKQLKKRPKRIL